MLINSVQRVAMHTNHILATGYVVYLSLCCVFINVPTLSKRFDLVSFFPHSLAYCLLHSEFLALSVCHHSLDGSASSVLKSSRDAAVSTAPLHAFHV